MLGVMLFPSSLVPVVYSVILHTKLEKATLEDSHMLVVAFVGQLVASRNPEGV